MWGDDRGQDRWAPAEQATAEPVIHDSLGTVPRDGEWHKVAGPVTGDDWETAQLYGMYRAPAGGGPAVWTEIFRVRSVA